MKIHIIFTKSYEYEIEGKDLDECLDVAEKTLLENDSNASDYEVDWKIIQDEEEMKF